jgi:glycosyltransferase involved in cell wall biosynthesis
LWEEPWSRVSVQACKLRDQLLPQAKIVSETEQNIDKNLPFPFEGYRKYTLARTDFAVGRSNQAVAVLRNKGYSGPAQTIPNAVDAQLFRPMDREKCRRELGFSGFVVGYVGRLVEEKGLLDLAKAVCLCPPDVRLVLVGDGPLRKRLPDRAQVLSGRPLAELPPLMNAVDVLVLPSRTTRRWKEQFGRVLIEANACGTPVIGSDSGAIPDVVGGGGLIAPERNPAALAAVIMQLRDDSARCRQLGETGRRQVIEHYTWQRVAEQMRDIYAQVVSPVRAIGSTAA